MYTYWVGFDAVVFCLEEGFEGRSNARRRRLNDAITVTHTPDEARGSPLMPAYELIKCGLFPTEIVTCRGIRHCRLEILSMQSNDFSFQVVRGWDGAVVDIRRAHNVIYTTVIEIFHVAAVASLFSFLALEHLSESLFAVSSPSQIGVRVQMLLFPTRPVLLYFVYDRVGV
jgi:hypothetical protein